MVISPFISSILILALGVWAYMRLESTMNNVAERQLLIEPSKFSYKMWKDMPVSMYQSFTFFNLTNWNQVKSIGQKPRFVEVGPYVYKTVWTKSDIHFMDEDKTINFAEKKQWIFDATLSKGSEDDLIWTINTPLMTALALIQNAPVITRNVVSVILDGLGEGAFIKRNIRSLLFEGYSDLIVSVGPLFDRRFANFNGRFAYLYNKNDSIDGHWTVSTGVDDLANLNKIIRYQSNIVNMTSFSSGQLPQGLNEVKPECATAWSLDQATNGQLFTPFSQDLEQLRLAQQLQQIKSKTTARSSNSDLSSSSSSPPQSLIGQQSQAPIATKRFFGRSVTTTQTHDSNRDHHSDLVPNPFMNQKTFESLVNGRQSSPVSQQQQQQDNNNNNNRPQLKDVGKYIFYPDLCRPLHLLPSKQDIVTSNGIKASRYYIDPRIFMNSTQIPANKCFEMNPRPPLANTLAATINSVTGANVAIPSLVTGASSPFALFSPPLTNHHHHNEAGSGTGGLFERSNHPGSFLNNALHSLGASVTGNQQQTADQQSSASSNPPVSRLGRVRQLFSNIVSQRMSAGSPGSLLPSLSGGPGSILMGNHFSSSTARNSPDHEPTTLFHNPLRGHHNPLTAALHDNRRQHNADSMAHGSSNQVQSQASPPAPPPPGGSDRWVTQFRFKWPRGVFSIGQCQLGAPIYASLPHFLDADDYYLEQVDGLKPNRSLHEFYIDIESTLHSIPVGAKARLQLNVATPELRFRNIPNAMIPVLWQEVTFSIDKPVATMLYWSFTMSSTIYHLISIALIVLGSILMCSSLVGGCRRSNKVDASESAEVDPESSSTTSGTSVVVVPQSESIQQQCVRHATVERSWQPQQKHDIHQHHHHHKCELRPSGGSSRSTSTHGSTSKLLE